jgi:hypothetical protein
MKRYKISKKSQKYQDDWEYKVYVRETIDRHFMDQITTLIVLRNPTITSSNNLTDFIKNTIHPTMYRYFYLWTSHKISKRSFKKRVIRSIKQVSR